MFCTTECWDCEDKSCEHYRSKRDLYFENKKLKNTWKELKNYIDNNKRVLQNPQILDFYIKMQELEQRKDE